MRKYTIISAHFDGNGWRHQEGPIANMLESVKDYYLLIPPGLWVFRTEQASSAIEKLATELHDINVTFLRVSFDNNPPIIDAGKEWDQKYREFIGM